MNRISSKYDVFLSYNWKDQAAVERIARALRDRGLTVFLDRWYLVPGRPWLPALEGVLGDCRSLAIFVSPHGMGSWQQRELGLAMNRQACDPGFPVIPVLLPNADPALGFLSLNTWVDLKAGLDDPVQLATLIAAVRGEPPGPDVEAGMQATLASICPYRGLRPFREEDASFFFGREQYMTGLAEVLKARHFIAVVGSSGSGKSSVVRAGLVPGLRSAAARQIWEVVTLTPGERPLHSLAAALVPLLEPEMTEVDRLIEVGKLADSLATARVGLRDVVEAILRKQPGTDRLLLVADQWEEIYTLPREGNSLRRFLHETLDATASVPLSVVLTLRSDFFGQALAHRPLADRLQDAVVPLGPMTRDELEQVTELPAKKVGLAFEPGLVDRILDDVSDEPGHLPLLEFVLTRLWENRHSGRLLHEVYEGMGGLRGAIAHRADDLINAMPSAGQEVTRRIFMHLVRAGEGTEDTRRRATFNELGDAARSTIEKLAGARLVVTGRDEATGAETLEVAHEALIRNWRLLQTWISEDREFLLWRQRLGAALEAWLRARNHNDVLLRGPQLTEAVRWQAERSEALTTQERNFIRRSVRTATSRRRRWRAGLATVATLLISLVVYATWNGVQAGQQAKRARSNSIALTASQVLASDPGLAALLVAELLNEPEPPRGASIARAVARSPLPASILRHSAAIVHVAFSPDGTRVVTASRDKTARVWRADGQGQPVVLTHDGPVSRAAFSPDGTQVVTASGDRTARVWRADGRGQPLVLQHDGWVVHAAFSPDGTRVVTASDDKTARVWRADGQGQPTVLTHNNPLRHAAFSPDGTRVVTASDDWAARVWRADGQGQPLVLTHSNPVWHAAFSPDGTRVVTASDDGTARVWRADGQGQPVVLTHANPVRHAAFSPDGTRVVTASADKTARVWRADGQGQPVVLIHGGVVWHAAFSPDGTRVVTASFDKTARVWRTDGQGQPVILQHDGWVVHVAFSPDGTQVVTASDTARVWRPDEHRQSVVLTHKGPVGHAAFSPDGTRVVTASTDRTARVWRADGQGQPLVLTHNDQVVHAAFSPDGTRVVTASMDRTARVWRTDGQGQPVIFQHDGWVRHAAFSPDGTQVVTASMDRTARVWRTDGQGQPVILTHNGEVWHAAFSPDGTQVVTASMDRTARVWRADGQGQPVILTHNGVVWHAAFSPDGTRVVTASGPARVWRTDGQGQPVVLIQDGSVSHATFSPDGTRVVTASMDRTARVWRADGQGQPVLLTHDNQVRHAAFSPDGTRVVTASDDKTARVWRADGQGQPVVLTHDDLVLHAAFSPDGTRVVTASDDRTAGVWLPNWDWAGSVAYLARTVHGCLTPPERIRFLGDESSEARKRYEACERRYGRRPID